MIWKLGTSITDVKMIIEIINSDTTLHIHKNKFLLIMLNEKCNNY